MGHGHHDMHGAPNDPQVADIAHIHDVGINLVEHVVAAVAQSLPDGPFADGAIAGLARARQPPGEDLATVFTQGLVANVVVAVLDTPVAWPQMLQLFGRSLLATEAGNGIDDGRVRRCEGVALAGADALGDLLSTWPVQIAPQLFTGGQGTGLVAPMALAVRGVAQPILIASPVRFGKECLDVVIQSG